MALYEYAAASRALHVSELMLYLQCVDQAELMLAYLVYLYLGPILRVVSRIQLRHSEPCLTLSFEFDDNAGYPLMGIQLQQDSTSNKIQIRKLCMWPIKNDRDSHDG